ncbi:sodium/hydrogen exchanger family protein [Halalkalibacter akibai JCM 9157]|uniref:Sodium/hydrogen exchanger family protein n=1 Tax=Halalkalibacter akibai (strain ATCC 43226 / DSM 21942 / CIP 109018 / JCM 9157 / 1139) TaxID=1236973 RepID=W4QZL3_HALA3|nr:cation:proton antiporter [Halalkalibacter akibai]GAE37347.1 sodium/hydrogen exchanger family protein [Halalkalibacter akibai JCM 9157]
MEIPEMLGAGLVLILLFLTGFIGTRWKIPEVIIFILLGIALGGFLSGSHLLHFAGEVGIVLLFFMLGMEFPITQLANVAKKVTPAGSLDVVLSFGVTFLICILFGLDIITSVLIGGVVYATSSSITAKLLESSKRMANPESEFILGLLIFEDLVAPVLVAILVGLTSGIDLTFSSLMLLMGKVFALTLGAILIGKYLFSKLGTFFDRHMSKDIFILFIIGLALAYGGLALYLDLSEVLGAFLAGIMLAEVRRTHELEHMIVSVRDLMLPLFFLYFGTTIAFDEGIPMVGLLVIIFIWSIVAKIAVGIYGGKWFGLSKRVALRAGFSLTQRGEFSIIIASLAAGPIKAFSSVFILLSAIVGIILFQFAPKIAKRLYGKNKPQEKIKVPGT